MESPQLSKKIKNRLSIHKSKLDQRHKRDETHMVLREVSDHAMVTVRVDFETIDGGQGIFK